MKDNFNNRVRQILLLLVVIFLAILLLTNFYIFLPSVLGAITLYILSRKGFFYLTEKKKWSKTWTSLLYILGYLIIICLPVYLAVILILPKLTEIFNDPVQLMIPLKTLAHKVQAATGIVLYNPENVQNATKKMAEAIPTLLTGTANFVTNLLLMFFVMYYMLVHGRTMEKYLRNFIPLKKSNLVILTDETNLMIRANAIGIPLLAVIQGLVAMLGYFIFGIKDFGVWGFVTGIASLIPIVGTGLIWLPLTIYLLSTGQNWQGIGLGIYSLAIITNIDYVARITVLRKIGDVHPLITIIGVIVGISMFGFLGLIFGPLLVSYFIVLVTIYRNEFFAEPIPPLHEELVVEK